MERHGVKGAWVLLAGILVGTLVVPSVAGAVGSIVTIQGAGSTKKANVTAGNQLQVAEAAPVSFREYVTSVSGDGNCHQFGSVPATRGFVVRSVVVNIPVASSAGFVLAQVWPNGSCTGSAMVSIPTKVVADYSFPIDPGIAVAHGSHFSIQVVSTGAVAAVHVFGYLVPSGDVPATTPITG